MLRRLLRLVFVATAGGAALVAGVLMALTLTPTGRGLLARTVARALNGAVLGSVEIGAIGGSFVRDLTFRGLVLRDTAGTLVARLPEARVRFTVPQLLRRRFIFTEVTLEQPEVHLAKYRNGRMNYEEVLRLFPKTGSAAAPPLVQLYNVQIRDGVLTLRAPWEPKVRSRAARDSARAQQLARHPGRRIEPGRDGLVQVTEFRDLTARLPYLLASSPTRKPIAARLDTLATRISDPQLIVTDAVGQIELRNDTLAFQFQRVALPGTEAVGGGRVTWPQDTVLFDFRFNAPRVALADLRFVSPEFPEMQGRGSLVARSETGTRTNYIIRDLVLLDGRERIEGDLTALADARRGLGVRGLRLQLTAIDLAKAAPYVDSLPFAGSLDGSMRADGFLDRLTLGIDWRYADAGVAGRPVTRVRGEGVVRLLASGLAFERFRLAAADADLGTVRRLAPVVPLAGRLGAVGVLNGTLADAVFTGRVTHADADLPVSAAEGVFALDTRGAEAVFDVDAQLDDLHFDGIRPAFPTLRLQGALNGRVALQGTLARLWTEFDVRGEIGQVTGTGLLGMTPPRLTADSLRVRVQDFDLAMLDTLWPSTRLNGSLEATGVLDTLVPPVGTLAIGLGPSRLLQAALDTATVRASVTDGLLTVDTMDARWNGARFGGSGTLGWAEDRGGRLLAALTADSLIGFDSVATAFGGAVDSADTTAAARAPLNGRVRMTMALSGALDSLEARVDLEAERLRWRTWRTPQVTGTFTWRGGATPVLTAALRSDTVTLGTRSYRNIAADVEGPLDLLSWSGGIGIGSAARFDARGRFWARLEPMIVSIDTLAAGLPSRAWSLANPVAVTLRDSTQAITPVALRTADGSGRVDIVGRIPGTAEGGLSLAVLGVDIKDIYTFLQRDTTGVGGTVSLTGELGGTAAMPTLTGAVAVEGLRIDEARLPLAQGAVQYGDRQLDAKLALWRTGAPVLEIESRLPIDLAWLDAGPRLVPDRQVYLRAEGDSVDLNILEALSNNLRDVSGTLAVDFRSDGTWGKPQLSGFAEIRDGRMDVRALGTSFSGVRGRFDLGGDSLSLRNVRLEGPEGGRLDVTGGVRFPPGLAQPDLNLTLDANNFRAMNLPDFLTLTGTGSISLTGPALGATLRGQATASQSTLYFADLVNKRVINIDDPAFADLVVADTIARVQLRPGLSTRFFDGLRVENFDLVIGDEVKLRSAEADISLGGNVRVNKQRGIYRFDGTMNAVRGTYNLSIAGILRREFTVERGTVRFFGRNDLNAELDIQARHVVRATSGDEIPVIARIEGTLYAPKVRLESTPERPLAEADLVGYLINGAPLGENIAGNTSNAAANSVLNSFVGEAISNLGVPFDLLEVKLSVPSGGGASLSQQQIQAGFQLSERTYLLLNASVCLGAGAGGNGALQYGVALQYRLSRAFRFQTSIEPRQQFCGATGGLIGTAALGRQFGADLLFEREF